MSWSEVNFMLVNFVLEGDVLWSYFMSYWRKFWRWIWIVWKYMRLYFLFIDPVPLIFVSLFVFVSYKVTDRHVSRYKLRRLTSNLLNIHILVHRNFSYNILIELWLIFIFLYQLIHPFLVFFI
jgi:hypothetical protein